ncbi:MAG: methylated-DNA--[protein]-cysteine S-methyltransferase [Dehalococcoidales bacterium]|nr:methylated-DNA--[protein]-cysteine S-methyltransferase [Dehalococcoidales bacterium]
MREDGSDLDMAEEDRLKTAETGGSGSDSEAVDGTYFRWLAGELGALPQGQSPAGVLPAVLSRAGGMAGRRMRDIGSAVRYGTADSALGPLFIAYTGSGIVRVGIGEVMREADFATELAHDFGVEAVRDGDLPRTVTARLRNFFAGGRLRPEEFDLAGLGKFEQQVLAKALEIPRGEVRPYAWVAGETGHPGASRAVGQALGRNPIPLLIPCHRVIRSDGGLGGYAFGLPLKQRILAMEGLDVAALQKEMRAGARYYGSRNTRIFCLPTCQYARRIGLPNRVRFRSAGEALAAGFRPCLVCRPS